MSKARSDSKLDRLPPEVAQALFTGLSPVAAGGGGWKLEQAREWLLSQHSVSSSISSLSTWFRRQQDNRREEEMLERIRSSAGLAERAEQTFAESGDSTFRAMAGFVKELAFRMALASQGGEPPGEELERLVKLSVQCNEQSLRERGLLIEERRVKLLEAKAAQSDQIKDITANAEITPEEKERRIREIFGMA